MRTTLDELLTQRAVLLADGATGTNYFQMGLGPGEPPELWNVDIPERVAELHPELGRHLANAVRTGTWCSYRPEAPISWDTTP